MRTHEPPTHVAYPARKFILVTGGQLVVLAGALVLGLVLLNHTAWLTPGVDPPGLIGPPNPPSPLPDALDPFAWYIRLGLSALPFFAAVFVIGAQIPRRVSFALRFLRTPKRTVYRRPPSFAPRGIHEVRVPVVTPPTAAAEPDPGRPA